MSYYDALGYGRGRAYDKSVLGFVVYTVYVVQSSAMECSYV